MKTKMKLVILTPECHEFISECLSRYCDEGPTDEGWQSNALQDAQTLFDDAKDVELEIKET